jgi:hypothetical protein
LSTTPIVSYNPDLLNLGTLMRYYDETNAEEAFAGPMPLAMARPMEQSTGFAVAFPYVMQWSDNIDWVFLIENSSASATRRVMLYEFYRDKAIFNWRGFVTVTFPTNTNHTSRALRVTYDKHTTGTVSASGTAVTGNGTNWSTDRLSVGARIGFGSTDPTQITEWFEISAVGSNTSITLGRSAGTFDAGTAYVIEEIGLIITTINATATNGGLFVTKGLNFNTFAIAGTTIPAATTTDNIRAVYWLGDAATSTNTEAVGCALGPRTSFQSQFVYVPDGAASALRFFVYNIREALSAASGKANNAFVLSTGSATVTGTLSQANNGRYDTLLHGPGANVASIYLVTTTRVIRCPVSDIKNGATNFVADTMVELPAGSTATFSATSSIGAVEVASNIDRLILTTTNNRSYITRYKTDASTFDHIFMADTRQLDQSTNDNGAYPHLAFQASAHSMCSEGGILYVCRNTTSSTSNQIYAIPMGAHHTYASITNQRIITPKIPTPNAKQFSHCYVRSRDYMGSLDLGIQTEPYRCYVRTSGIDDNSGDWTLMEVGSCDISGLEAGDFIQFMFEFRMAGTFCVPNRIYGVCVTYEEDSLLPDEMEWNYADSNSSDGTLGFKQITLFTGGVPTLTIDYYRSDNGANVLTQSSASTTNGTFQYWNGSTWVNGLGSNSVGVRRRFVPSAGLPAGVDVYAKIVAG